jgi:FMN-binding domain
MPPRLPATSVLRRLLGVAGLLLMAGFIPHLNASTPRPDSQHHSETAFDRFLASHISEPSRQPQVLWVNAELRARAEAILGHSFAGLRVRYWGEGSKTLWVLDEIGKEMPITIGLIVDKGQIADVKILEYRETRGGEVQYPFFTSQFHGLQLAEGRNALDSHIDGITGATLSVAAVRKVAILALVFHQYTPFSKLALDQ